MKENAVQLTEEQIDAAVRAYGGLDPDNAINRESCRRAILAAHSAGAHDDWKLAVDDELVIIGSTADSFDSPKVAVAALIDWHVSAALDPAISKSAQDLIDKGRDRSSGLVPFEPFFKAAETKLYADYARIGEAFMDMCNDLGCPKDTNMLDWARDRITCDTCHGTGRICIGNSDQESDGNAPEFERCPSCGYGDASTSREREEQQGALPAYDEISALLLDYAPTLSDESADDIATKFNHSRT